MTQKQAMKKLEKMYPENSVVTGVDMWRFNTPLGGGYRKISCRVYVDNDGANKNGEGETWDKAFKKLEKDKFKKY